MENGEKGRMPSLDDVMRAVLPEDMPMHPDHPMQQAEPAPSKYSDVVSDGGMDPRNAPAPAQDEREAYSSTLTQGELNLVRTVLSGTVTGELVSRVTSALAARPAQTEQQPVAWGAFHFGGRRNGKLYAHCETEEQIESYIADLHRSNDSITLRKGPLYAAPIAQTEQPFTFVCLLDGKVQRQGSESHCQEWADAWNASPSSVEAVGRATVEPLYRRPAQAAQGGE